MSNVLPVEDLSKTYLEHSMVINKTVCVVSLVMVCSMNGVRTMIK